METLPHHAAIAFQKLLESAYIHRDIVGHVQEQEAIAIIQEAIDNAVDEFACELMRSRSGSI